MLNNNSNKKNYTRLTEIAKIKTAPFRIQKLKSMDQECNNYLILAGLTLMHLSTMCSLILYPSLKQVLTHKNLGSCSDFLSPYTIL